MCKNCKNCRFLEEGNICRTSDLIYETSLHIDDPENDVCETYREKTANLCGECLYQSDYDFLCHNDKCLEKKDLYVEFKRIQPLDIGCENFTPKID